MGEEDKMRKRKSVDEVGNTTPIAAAVTTTKDPFLWEKIHLDWYSQVVKKDLVGILLYSALFYQVACLFDPLDADIARLVKQDEQSNHVITQKTRTILTILLAIFAFMIFYVDVFRGTKPEPGDNKWHLLGDGLAGHFAYLTVHIVVLQAIYWIASAMSEVAILLSWDKTNKFWDQLLAFCYFFSVFSSTLGTLLTILFLKFNWFEPSWRRDVLEMYLSRGQVYFKFKVLFTHIPQIVVAFIDVALLKHPSLLKTATPSLKVTLTCCVVFAVFYISLVHANYHYNGNYYPYPILKVVLATWSSEATFVGGIGVFCFLIATLYRMFASGFITI